MLFFTIFFHFFTLVFLPRILNILFHLFLFILFLWFIVVNLFILNAQMLRCWGITIRFWDGKRTMHWYYCAYLLFVDIEFWDGKQNSLYYLLFIFKAQMLRCWRRNYPVHPNTLPKCHIVISYVQGICESIKKICGKHGVAVHFKEGQILKNILVSPKDKDSMANKNSVIYSYIYGRIDCDEEYIRESARTFGKRFKEHFKAPHQNSSGHKTSMENFQILGREENSMARTIKEAMYIRVNNPTLNRNIGKYNLPHIWDRVLFTIPELKINK